MIRSIGRWLCPTLSLFVLGPAAYLVTSSLGRADGLPDATLLLSSTPVLGLLAGAIVFALAWLAGVLAARLVSPFSGLTHAGFVLAWAAWGTGPILPLVRAGTSPDGALRTLALEGLLVAGLSAVLAVLIARAAPTVRAESSDDPPESGRFDSRLIGAFAVAIMAGAVASWIVAREPLKGQAIGAAAAAGIAAAVAARVLTSAATPAAFFVAAVGALGAVSSAYAAATAPSGDRTLALLYAGTMTPLASITPLDWAAGAFLGVPLGLAWAASLVGRKPGT